MEFCHPIDCGEFAVTPMLVAPDCAPKCCEESPICYPCLPRCTKPVYYCCEKVSKKPHYDDDCCHHHYSPTCHSTPPPAKCYSTPPPEKCYRPPPPAKCYDQRPQPHHDSCKAPTPYCESCCPPPKPVKTKYIIPCYRYEDGRIVRKLPVSAFKRNGMQDQEHSKLLGTANFLMRCPRDVSIECDVCTNPVKVADPAKVPPCCPKHALGCGYLKKKPIENQPTVLMRRACEVACGARARKKPFIVSSYAADPYNEVRRYHCEDERGNCCYHFERNKPMKHCNPYASPCQPCVSCPGCQYEDCVYSRPVESPSCCYYCR